MNKSHLDSCIKTYDFRIQNNARLHRKLTNVFNSFLDDVNSSIPISYHNKKYIY